MSVPSGASRRVAGWEEGWGRVIQEKLKLRRGGNKREPISEVRARESESP